MSIDIAIVVSQRFECLNVYLDIIKNNFKRNYTTHVFCNLCESDLKQYSSHLDFTLIDHFHHFPDDCKMKQKIDVYNSRKYKRQQPLRLLLNTLETMVKKSNVEKFIYTECDVFPLNEEKYVQYYEHTTSEKMYAYYNSDCDTKSTYGFIVPAPLYISKFHAKNLSNVIKKEVDDPIVIHTNSFEGRLMNCLVKSKITPNNIQKYHANNSFFNRNLMSETETTHQHNILNLSNVLVEKQLTNGNWIKNLLSNNEFSELYSGEIIKKDPNFKLEYWK